MRQWLILLVANLLLHRSWCLLRLLRVLRLVDRRLLLLQLSLLLILLLLRLLLVLLRLRCLRHVLLLSLLLLQRGRRLLLLGLHILLLLRRVLHGSNLLGARRLRVCGGRPWRRRRPVVLGSHIEIALLGDRLGALLRRRRLLPAAASAARRSSPPPAAVASTAAHSWGCARCSGMCTPLRLLPLLHPRLLLQRGVLLFRRSTPPKTLLLNLLLLQLPGLSICHQHLCRVGPGAATPAGIVPPPPAPALAPALCTWLVAAVVRAAMAKQEQRVNTSNFGARTPVSMHLKAGQHVQMMLTCSATSMGAFFFTCHCSSPQAERREQRH